jgi:hypothetical protein
MRLAATLTLALLTAGCRRAPEPAVTIDSEIVPRPVRVGPATISLRLRGKAARPVTGALIALEGDMSHAGMAPVFGDARETEPGHYEGSLNFTMPGDWVVLMHVTLANGQKLERETEVRGVGAN